MMKHGGCRRTLDPEVARDMVRVRDARRAFRRFYTQCFWSCRPDLIVFSRGEYATSIQHPDDRQKHPTIRNNQITVYPLDGDLSHADQWYLIALHRRGVPEPRTRDGKDALANARRRLAG